MLYLAHGVLPTEGQTPGAQTSAGVTTTTAASYSFTKQRLPWANLCQDHTPINSCWAEHSLHVQLLLLDSADFRNYKGFACQA